MADNEIIKALECCNRKGGTYCKLCPMWEGHETVKCIESLLEQVLRLINRQKAEIERLQLEIHKLTPKGCGYGVQAEVSERLEQQIKHEAIKEFAERLKESVVDCSAVYVYDFNDISNCIDNLVKEMTEEKDNA